MRSAHHIPIYALSLNAAQLPTTQPLEAQLILPHSMTHVALIHASLSLSEDD